MTADDPKQIAEEFRKRMLPLSDDQRMDVLYALNFCRHCGCDEAKDGYVHPCQCWNDE